MPFNTYRPDMMGEARIDISQPLVCGEWASFQLTYTAGFFGIDDLGGIKVSFRSASDQTPYQLDDPNAPGYVSVQASNGARLNTYFKRNSNIRPWGTTLFIQCGNFLAEGDEITINIGDRSQGSQGVRVQTFCEDTFEFRIHVDAFATYDYVVLPDEKQTTIHLIAGEPSVYRALLPTLRIVDDQFSLGIKSEDRWGNPTDAAPKTLSLRASCPVTGLPETVSMANSGGVVRIEGLSVTVPGDLVVEVLDDSGATVAVSNNLRTVETSPFRHFWSDMHGQSEETIGTNSARDYFTFARDKGLVDICGHQGNDFQITDTFWKQLNELTAEFDEPGRFLAIPGYEWSGNTSVGGDHNVWFRQEGRPIYRAHRTLVMDDSTDENECLDARQLFERLQGEDALVTAHVGGRFADVSYAHNANLEPSVEVHSAWGTFDWIFEDAMRSGYRVGIVSASDGHKGRPGASYPGASKFGSYGGLTCHLMRELDRDHLFKAFRRRRHFCTTGCRAYLNVKIDGLDDATVQLPGDRTQNVAVAYIGDKVACSNAEITLQIEVVGHSGIERIEVKDGIAVLKKIQPRSDAQSTGNRIRIQCEGAEYKGRGRLVEWDVKVNFDEATVERIETVNFWNPDRSAHSTDHQVAWANVTTGGTHAVDVWLSNATAGNMRVSSNWASFELDLSDLGTADYLYDCGGLRKAIRTTRLPSETLDTMVQESLHVTLEPEQERALYVRVVFEDGHIAWSSPIYISRATC